MGEEICTFSDVRVWCVSFDPKPLCTSMSAAGECECEEDEVR